MSQLSSESGSEYQATPTPAVFDTYLCTEPAGDVALLIRNGPDEYTASMRTLQRSADYFAEKNQGRAVERLQWEMAKVHMQHEQWERATRTLTPLWQTLSWRKSGWWQLLEEVDWALHECATRIRSLETLIAVDWELSSNSLTPRQDWNGDFSNVLQSHRPLQSRPRVVVKAESVVSCVCATFAFSTSEGNVGVDLQSQVLISSRAHASSKPFTISQVKVAFGGNLKNFIIQHDPSQAPPASSSNGLVHIYGVPLQRASPEASLTPTSPATSKASQLANDLTGLANLTIVPGATKAFSIDHVPRDAGEAEVASLTFCLNEDDFDLKVIITEDEQLHQSVFWVSSETGPTVKTLKSGRSSTVKILPKPPKMQIECRNVALTYYTDEVIDIDVWVMNDEDEEAMVTLEARLVGSGGPLPHIAWTSAEEDEELRAQSAEAEQLGQSEKTSISQAIGNVASSSEQSHGVHIHALPDAGDYVVEVRARYYLLSDPETPISKFSSANIFIKLPFEVSYSFTPMINPEPWPSYFNVDELGAESEDAGGKEEQANGLIQMWQLMSRIYSLASEAFNIDHVDPRVLEIHEAASCNITPGPEDTSKLTSIAPNDLQERSFHLKAQKTDLEDRRSTFLDLRLEVSWRREGSQKAPTVTYLAVPELVIPFGEPRVLATAKNGEEPPGVIHLQYVIENPSTYALAFSLTMDPSEDFAFSGPKNVSVELLPLSRHTVPYNLMPLVKGAWITPQLRVFDTHFHKALKVNATEGMRSDKKGLSIWVDADG